MIGNQQFILEMTTDQVKGLGGRTSLETGHGMIFPFRGWYPAKMTMDDMKFPLDFIIVGKDDNIIQIERNVQPAEGVILTFPPCKMIIEINAGESHTVLLNDIVSGVSFFQNYMVKSVGEAPGASNARAHEVYALLKMRLKTWLEHSSTKIKEKLLNMNLNLIKRDA